MRLRLNNSRDQDFDEAVDRYSKAFAISGHNYQAARTALMACKSINREKYLKGESAKKRSKKKSTKSTKKLFWIAPYDPRMMHQRKIISRNYHLLARDEKFSKLYPRKNIVAGCKRLRNLMEHLSPTVARKSNLTTPPSQPEQ